jgi:hypothetical protein
MFSYHIHVLVLKIIFLKKINKFLNKKYFKSPSNEFQVLGSMPSRDLGELRAENSTNWSKQLTCVFNNVNSKQINLIVLK